MKDRLAMCVMSVCLLGPAGCNRTASEPAAQTPATNADDRQEVMKPAMDDSPGLTNEADSSTEAVVPDPSAAEENSETTKP